VQAGPGCKIGPGLGAWTQVGATEDGEAAVFIDDVEGKAASDG